MSNKTIMIVDDAASIRQVAAIALRGAGYEVLEAPEGQAALNTLGGRRVNLVISDVNMPGMDGLSFVRALKQKPEHKFTPVLMLTTESGESKKAEGKAAGARAWMVKPFQPQQLLDTVAKLVA